MRWLYPFALTLFLAACGGGSDPAPVVPEAPPPQLPPPQEPPPQADACAPASQQETVSGYMGLHYFWHANLAAPDTSAPTISQYFSSLLYKPTDRYSFS